MENKKTVQITTGQLQQIVKEGVARLHRQTLIENRIKQINEELDYINGINDLESNQQYICWNAGSGIYDIAKYNSSISWHNDEDVFMDTREECEQYKEEMEGSHFEKNNFDDNYWDQKSFISEENNEVASPSMINPIIVEITIQVRGGWQEIITILPEEPIEDGYYKVFHKFDDGKELTINEGFYSLEDAENWVYDSYLPNYKTYELIDRKEKLYDNLNEYKELTDDNISENPVRYISEENNEVASPSMINTINGYLEAALWTEEEELGPSNIESDVSFESKVDAYTDIKKFKQLAGELIAQSGLDDEQIGHDLWLSRNGHGTGFFDRGLGEIGDKLDDIATQMGSKSVYLGDDGLIYID